MGGSSSENAKQQAILMASKSQVSSDEEHIHLDLHSLRRKHAELVGELSNSYHKEEKLLSEVHSNSKFAADAICIFDNCASYNN